MIAGTHENYALYCAEPSENDVIGHPSWLFAFDMRFKRARRHRRVRGEHKDKQGPLLAFFMVSSALLHAFGWLVNPDRHHSEAASRTSLNWSQRVPVQRCSLICV